MSSYVSECSNVYQSSGDGYMTQESACNNCQTPSQYMQANFNPGGTCSPFTDTSDGNVSAVNQSDGTYGFVSDGTNWYWESPMISSLDQQTPQDACSNPVQNQFQNENYPVVGSCSNVQENFEIFGMKKSYSILLLIAFFILVVFGICIYIKKYRK
jgi:hypothetical protein